jgi:hypothetical protein
VFYLKLCNNELIIRYYSVLCNNELISLGVARSYMKKYYISNTICTTTILQKVFTIEYLAFRHKVPPVALVVERVEEVELCHPTK